MISSLFLRRTFRSNFHSLCCISVCSTNASTSANEGKLLSVVQLPSTTKSHKQLRCFSIASYLVKKAPLIVQPYLRLMRADKPIGFWLLFWPCTWSLTLAAPTSSPPDLHLLGLFALGAFLMRSAGCVINDMWDRGLDAKVQRTKTRPLASGELSGYQAFGLLTGLLSGSLSILLQLNWLSVGLGASSLAFVVAYPLAKRYTDWPQVVLGFTFNWGALLGYTAASNNFNASVVLPLYAAGVFWTLIYDTIYAHQDKTDDLLAGIRSTALLFGDGTRNYLAGFSALMLANLLLVGANAELEWPYYVAVAGTGIFLGRQVMSLRTEDAEDCWRKFRSHRHLGAILFLGLLSAKLEQATKLAKKNVMLETEGYIDEDKEDFTTE